MFVMKARVVAGWIEQEAIDALLAQQAGSEEAPELTEEERARVGGVFQPAPPIPVQPPSEGAEHQSRDDTPNE
jgi:hypothetical protein